jgi:hypothetical protein
MAQRPNPDQSQPPVERCGTVIETNEDIRHALLSGLKGQPRVAEELGLTENATLQAKSRILKKLRFEGGGRNG